MWNKIKKFFEPSEKDNERVERWKEATNDQENIKRLQDKLTIESFDKAVNPKEEVEEVQVTKHMSVKKKKSKKAKSHPVNYNF